MPIDTSTNSMTSAAARGAGLARYRCCPLCGACRVRVIYHIRLFQPEGSGLPDAWDLVACDPCDFVYADTPASQGDYDLYYATKAKYSGPLGTGIGEDATDARRIEEAAERIASLSANAGARILDLGCGGGGLLMALRRRGFSNLMGVDPDPLSVARLDSLGLSGAVGTLARLPTDALDGPFDLVVLSHVAEHLRDLSLLSGMESLLFPGGSLYLEVPDALGYGEHPRSPFYYFDSEHIDHFGPRALAGLAQVLGLPCLALSRFTLPLADGGRYPACAAVFGHGPVSKSWAAERAGANETSVEPGITVAAVESYLRWSVSAGAQTVGPAQGPFLAWGAGSLTQRLLGTGQLPGERILAFLDGDPKKAGGTIAGRPILEPAQGLGQYPGVPVLICAAIAGDAILDRLGQIEPGSGRPVWGLTTENRGERIR